MNVTEQFEEVLRLALACPASAHTLRSAGAVNAFAKRTGRMRAKLDQQRREREFFRRRLESFDRMRAEVERLPECGACAWKPYKFSDSLVNPLMTCTGEFGCALECLRYKSSEYTPLLPSRTSP